MDFAGSDVPMIYPVYGFEPTTFFKRGEGRWILTHHRHQFFEAHQVQVLSLAPLICLILLGGFVSDWFCMTLA